MFASLWLMVFGEATFTSERATPTNSERSRWTMAKCKSWRGHKWVITHEGPLRPCRVVRLSNVVCNEVQTCSRCNLRVEM